MPRHATGSDPRRKNRSRIPSNATAKAKDRHAKAAASAAAKSANAGKAIAAIKEVNPIKEGIRISNIGSARTAETGSATTAEPGSAMTAETGMPSRMKWMTVVRRR